MSGLIHKLKKLVLLMNKQCSDFDIDCFSIQDPFACWLGHPEMEIIPGELVTLPVADGYCPLCKKTDEAYNKDEIKS